MAKIKAGINGMGRIGRNLARAIVGEYPDEIELVAVNDLVSADLLAGALMRDSTYGSFPREIKVRDDNILFGDIDVKVYSERNPKDIPWNAVDIVFECSGHFLTKESAQGHLEGGAKMVVLSAPPKDDTRVFVIGVNESALSKNQKIISNASCTTNCLAPIVFALDRAFGVENGILNTIHAVTNNQTVLDIFGNERARSVLNNIIPTTTGAAKSVGKVIPHLEGKLNGGSLRVPVSVGSVGEAVLTVRGRHDEKEIAAALKKAAANINSASPRGTVLYVGDKCQVSSDVVGSIWSSMVLEKNIMVLPGEGTTLVRITSFYDNEMGYAHRLAELGIIAARK